LPADPIARDPGGGAWPLPPAAPPLQERCSDPPHGRLASRGEALLHRKPSPSGGKRLVMLNRFFVPDQAPTGQLLSDLAEHLAAAGVAVTVIASRPRPSPDGTGHRGGSGIRVVDVWSSTLGLPGVVGRLAEYATFTAGAALRLFAEVRAGDTLLVKTDPPLSCVLGWLVARARRAEVVNWCQDLFPEVAAALGFRIAAGPVGWAMRGLRNSALRAARLNVAICEQMAERLRRQGIGPDRVTVIPNWADGALIRPLPHRDNRLRRDWQLEGKFVIGYAGNLGRSHDPQPLITLMQRLEPYPDVVFVLIGGGTGYERLRRAVAERHLRNVQFRPYQPRERLAEALSALDLHIVTLRPACEGLAFPSKLYGAMAAGRPILFIGDPEGEEARLLSSTGAGLAVDGDDADAGAAAVARLRLEGQRRGALARAAFDRRFRQDLALAAWAFHLTGTVAVPMPLSAQRA
jgi:colanic acid biosynthesis glycosyl transferase WcaI